VIALMVPPLPAPSRPSKTMQTLRPFSLTHSCSLTSSTWSFFISRAYSFPEMAAAGAAAADSKRLPWRPCRRPLLALPFGLSVTAPFLPMVFSAD
jgi:hypothetical protein